MTARYMNVLKKLEEERKEREPYVVEDEKGNKVNQDRVEADKKLASLDKKLKDRIKVIRVNREDDSSDVKNVLSNLGLGLKKGLMNAGETVVSEINNPWYKDEDLQKSLQERGNKLREDAGKEPLEIKTYDERMKEMLGDSYNKDLLGRDKEEQKEKWNKTKQDINIQIAKNIENSDSAIGKKLADVAPSIGNMLPNFIPGVGPFYAVASAKGAYMEDANARGMSENEANAYSGIMGLAEGLTDYIGAGLTKSVGKSLIKGSSKQALKYFGLDIAENFIEEAVIEPISETTATLTGGKETANWDNMGKRMLNSGIDGALVAIITGGTSAGIAKAVQVTNKLRNNQQVTTQEVSEAVKETLQSDKIDHEQLKNTIKENTNKLIIQTQNEINTLNKKLPKASDTTQVQELQNELKWKNKQLNALQNNVAETSNVEGSFTKQQELLNNIENNQETLYNNNESEVGINGQRAEIQRNQELFGQYDTRIQQESKQQEGKKYTREKYEQWEQSIKPIEYRNLADEQRQVSNNIKRQYGKDIVFFDGNNTTYNGGASIKDASKIYVNANEANEFGVKRVALHEVMESDIAHNKELKEDIIIPLIDAIQQDPNFQEQKNRFWENQNEEIPSDFAIAKDIICDRFAEIESGEELDYDNVLSQETNMNIEFAINNFRNQLNNKKAPSMGNNTLPVGEYTKKQNRANQSLLDWLDYKHIDYEIDENNNIISIENENAIEQYYKEINENTADLPMFANEIIEKETNTEKYSKYKQSIIKSRESEINNLIAYKNKTIKNIENKIAEKQRILNSKKNKDSKVANNLKMQIENLTRQKVSIENQYVARIERKEKVLNNAKINQETKKSMHLTREEVRDRLFKEMQISDKDLSVGKDIKNLNYQFTDPVRVNEKVFGKEIGDKINNATINKTKHNTAEKIRWQNKERQEIKNLGIKARTEESAAVQKYGEKQWVNEKGEIVSYGDFELSNEFPNVEAQNKIKKAAQVLRNKYDTYIDQINEVLIGLGYNPVPKRNDYMRHFHELGDMFSQSGVPFNLNDMSAEDLPTDINGLTEFNKPGKNWFANSQIRYGNKTTYDAITGIDGYLEGAGNLIFHTEDIQNYRALSEAIRNQFGEKGFENLEGLTESETEQRIKDIQDNKLSRYVAWLDEQANSLAGKKGAIDRGFERFLGRKGYTLLNTVKKQVGSNMTGFNARSSLTNFIAPVIAASKTNKIAFCKGTVSTVWNMFKKDGFVEKSDFLTSRFGSDVLSAKLWQKISNAGQIFMAGSDYFTSNLIARSKYFEGLQMGMTEKEALNYSNDFSSKVMGDRSQGAMPEAFNSKTFGLFTQFQLEVNNQWQYMIHDTKMEYQENLKDKGGLKAGATMLFQMGQLAAYSYFFNELFEKLTGTRATFDPIEIFKTLFGLEDDDDEKTFDQRIAEAGEMLVDYIPLGNLITGGGRIPITEAFQGIGTLAKKLTNQKNQYGGEISWGDVREDLLSSLAYWIAPTGYSQAKKTVQGLKTVMNNGDYKVNSKGEKELRFPVENKNVGTYLKAGLFGKYALPTAQDYVKRDYTKLSANQTKTFEESGLTYKQYLNYVDTDLKNKKEKLDYINKQEWTYEQKWNIYRNDILSSTERKDGSSQLSDAEYIVSHGVSKTKFIELYNKAYKHGIDMPTTQEYKEMQKKGITLERYIYDKIYKK